MATKLYLRGKTWYVRYNVPVRYRSLYGRPDVWKSTGTDKKREAESLKHGLIATIMRDVQAKVKLAEQLEKRSPTPISALLESASELNAQVERGELEYDTAHEIFGGLIESRLTSLGISPEDDLNSSMVHTIRGASKVVSHGDQHVPLTSAIDRYLTEKESSMRTSTHKMKRRVLEAFVGWSGNTTPAEVTRRTTGDYISQIIIPMDRSRKTKETYLSALVAAWNWFKRKGLTENNPWEGMVADLPKENTTKAKERPWTPEEIAKLHTLDKADPIYQVCVIRLHSGTRVEEICALKAENVDLEAKTMRLISTEADPLKNQNSDRTLPIHPAVLPMMHSLVENATPDGYLFDLARGGHDKKRSTLFNKRSLYWVRRHVSTDPTMYPYTLRHSYSQAMRDLGIDKETIEFTTGHKDQSMLFGTYAASVAIERLRAAVDKLDFGF